MDGDVLFRFGGLMFAVISVASGTLGAFQVSQFFGLLAIYLEICHNSNIKRGE